MPKVSEQGTQLVHHRTPAFKIIGQQTGEGLKGQRAGEVGEGSKGGLLGTSVILSTIK